MECPLRICALALVAGALTAQAAAPSLEVVRSFARNVAPSRRLCWSPDGRWIGSAGELGDVVVVDAQTGRIAHAFDAIAMPGPGPGLAFSPDGRVLAVAGGELTLWDTATWQQRPGSVPGEEYLIAWSADSRVVATCSQMGIVSLFDARNLSRIRDLRVTRGEDRDVQQVQQVQQVRQVRQIGFAADGRRIAVRIDALTVVLDTATGAEMQWFSELQGGGGPFAWLADGRLLRANWQLYGQGLAPQPLRFVVQDMAADPAGRLCVFASDRGMRGRCGDETFAVEGTGPIAVAPDGEHWVRANGTTLEWFARGARQRRTALAHHAEPPAMAITGDGRHLASSASDSPAAVRPVEVRTVADDRVVPADIAAAVQEQLLAEAAARESAKEFAGPVGGRVLHVDWAPDCLGRRRARLELSEGRSAPHSLDLPEPGRPVVRWSPDGKRIAVFAGRSIETRLHILDGADLHELRALDGGFCDLAWLDDGRVLALASNWLEAASELLVLDVATGRELALVAFPGAARTLQPDDKCEHALVTLLDRVLLIAIRQ
jgi:hypothetical protein